MVGNVKWSGSGEREGIGDGLCALGSWTRSNEASTGVGVWVMLRLSVANELTGDAGTEVSRDEVKELQPAREFWVSKKIPRKKRIRIRVRNLIEKELISRSIVHNSGEL